MPFGSFQAFYQSEAQSLFLLWAIPIAFLAWRAAVPTPNERAAKPDASRFVAGLTLIFAVETLIDPVATGPLTRAFGLKDTLTGSALMFAFVWLGDFRVFALVLGVAAPANERRRALLRAMGVTFALPVTAGTINALLQATFSDLPGNALWVIYEIQKKRCFRRLWINSTKQMCFCSKILIFLKRKVIV